ncbi:MAG: YaeQ family protein [Nitrospirota bacterium]|nr:YaeQ family protein [Nitrospirota bacterium]
MALKSTIFKADLSISDMTRNYYHDHSVTIARHPSENDERMMVRLLAFGLHADEALIFGNKIGNDDEPDLWQRDLTGAIDLWIDVGQPDEKLVRRACGRSRMVCIYPYSGHSAAVWWDQAKHSLEKIRNLQVVSVPEEASRSLAKLAQRTMKLQFTIQDNQIWVSNGNETVHVELRPFLLRTR